MKNLSYLFIAAAMVAGFLGCHKNDGGGTDPVSLANKIKDYENIITSRYLGDTAYMPDFSVPGANGGGTPQGVVPSFLMYATPFVLINSSTISIGPPYHLIYTDSIPGADHTIKTLFAMSPGTDDGLIHISFIDFTKRPFDGFNRKDYILDNFSEESNNQLLNITFYYINAQNQKAYASLRFFKSNN
jgi:hypothetical protein